MKHLSAGGKGGERGGGYIAFLLECYSSYTWWCAFIHKQRTINRFCFITLARLARFISPFCIFNPKHCGESTAFAMLVILVLQVATLQIFDIYNSALFPPPSSITELPHCSGSPCQRNTLPQCLCFKCLLCDFPPSPVEFYINVEGHNCSLLANMSSFNWGIASN